MDRTTRIQKFEGRVTGKKYDYILITSYNKEKIISEVEIAIKHKAKGESLEDLQPGYESRLDPEALETLYQFLDGTRKIKSTIKKA
jgi:hypothetical protein